jgi:glycosyltransferase involved in cell wall biosynthesis
MAMKVLFVTTTWVSIEREHFFTQNVLNGLIDQGLEITALSLLHGPAGKVAIEKTKHRAIDYYRILIDPKIPDQQTTQILKEQFARIKPDVIHLNGYHISELDAASEVKIPVVMTVHEGGVICPGGRGFLNWNDEICNAPVSQKNCYKCCIRNFPVWRLWYILFGSIPLNIRMKLGPIARNKKFVPIVSPAFMYAALITEKIAFVEKLKSISAIILASTRLKEAFERNGIKNNLALIPHGIPNLKRYALPPIEDKIKFFYLGRVEFSKGIHVMIDAFKGIDCQKYELHIIGDQPGNSRRIVSYQEYVYRKSRGLNVFWHGRVPYKDVEEFISQFHVMIHPAIYLEVFGTSISESLSSGRPVLATRCGGAEMQIIDEFNGWLINPNSSGELAAKVAKIIENPELIRKYSDNCRVPNFDEYLLKLIDLYSDRLAPFSKEHGRLGNSLC